MPALSLFGARQHFSGDDLAAVAALLAIVHGCWAAVLVGFAVVFSTEGYCTGRMVIAHSAEAAVTGALFLTDAAVVTVAIRGSPLETSRRRLIAPLLYLGLLLFAAALALRLWITIEAAGPGNSQTSSYWYADQITWAELALTAIIAVCAYFSVPDPQAREGSWQSSAFDFHMLKAVISVKFGRDPLTQQQQSTEGAILRTSVLLARELGLVASDALLGMLLVAAKARSKREAALASSLKGGLEEEADGAAASAAPGKKAEQAAGQPPHGPDAASGMAPTESGALEQMLTPPAMEPVSKEAKERLRHGILGNRRKVKWGEVAAATSYLKFAAASYALKQGGGGGLDAAKKRIQEVAELQADHLHHVQLQGRAHYFIAYCERTKAVVLSIHCAGDLSALVDEALRGEPVPMAEYLITPPGQIAGGDWERASRTQAGKLALTEGWLAGFCSPMLLAGAQEVMEDLSKHRKLQQLLIGEKHMGEGSAGGADPREAFRAFESFMHHRRMRLVVTGHSLGAGVAALVALKLEQSFPNIKAWCYSPPGAVLSPHHAAHMAKYCVSVVAGKDLVPRLCRPTLLAMRDRVARCLALCKRNKWRVVRDKYLGKGVSAEDLLHAAWMDVPQESRDGWSEAQRAAAAADAVRAERGAAASAEQALPGAVMFLRPLVEEADGGGGGGSGVQAHIEPLWVEAKDLYSEGILLSYEMLQVHHMTEMWLWLLESLGDSQRKGMTGVVLPPRTGTDAAPHSGGPAEGSGGRQQSGSGSRGRLAPRPSLTAHSSRFSVEGGSQRSVSFTALRESHSLGLQVLDSWVPHSPAGSSTDESIEPADVSMHPPEHHALRMEPLMEAQEGEGGASGKTVNGGAPSALAEGRGTAV